MIAAITKKLSDPYDCKFPYDRYDRYRILKMPEGPGTNSDVLHSGIFFIATIATISGAMVFHMIATITTIVEIELRSIVAIVVATIATIATFAEEWFPYDRNELIVAIVAIIWRPAFRKAR